MDFVEVDEKTLIEWLNSGADDTREMQVYALENFCMIILTTENISEKFNVGDNIIPTLLGIISDGRTPPHAFELAVRCLSYLIEASTDVKIRRKTFGPAIQEIGYRLNSLELSMKCDREMAAECIKLLSEISNCPNAKRLPFDATILLRIIASPEVKLLYQDTVTSIMSLLENICCHNTSILDELSALVTNDNKVIADGARQCVVSFGYSLTRKKNNDDISTAIKLIPTLLMKPYEIHLMLQLCRRFPEFLRSLVSNEKFADALSEEDDLRTIVRFGQHIVKTIKQTEHYDLVMHCLPPMIQAICKCQKVAALHILNDILSVLNKSEEAIELIPINMVASILYTCLDEKACLESKRWGLRIIKTILNFHNKIFNSTLSTEGIFRLVDNLDNFQRREQTVGSLANVKITELHIATSNFHSEILLENPVTWKEWCITKTYDHIYLWTSNIALKLWKKSNGWFMYYIDNSAYAMFTSGNCFIINDREDYDRMEKDISEMAKIIRVIAHLSPLTVLEDDTTITFGNWILHVRGREVLIKNMISYECVTLQEMDTEFTFKSSFEHVQQKETLWGHFQSWRQCTIEKETPKPPDDCMIQDINEIRHAIYANNNELDAEGIIRDITFAFQRDDFESGLLKLKALSKYECLTKPELTAVVELLSSFRKENEECFSKLIKEIFTPEESIELVRCIKRSMASLRRAFSTLYYQSTDMSSVFNEITFDLRVVNCMNEYVLDVDNPLKSSPLLTVAELKKLLVSKINHHWYIKEPKELTFCKLIQTSSPIALDESDKHGVIQWVGTNALTEEKWVNPFTHGLMRLAKSDNVEVVDCDVKCYLTEEEKAQTLKHRCMTKSSWIEFDLNLYMIPTSYSFVSSEASDVKPDIWSVLGSFDRKEWKFIRMNNKDGNVPALKKCQKRYSFEEPDLEYLLSDDAESHGFRFIRLEFDGKQHESLYLRIQCFDFYGKILGVPKSSGSTGCVENLKRNPSKGTKVFFMNENFCSIPGDQGLGTVVSDVINDHVQIRWDDSGLTGTYSLSAEHENLRLVSSSHKKRKTLSTKQSLQNERINRINLYRSYSTGDLQDRYADVIATQKHINFESLKPTKNVNEENEGDGEGADAETASESNLVRDLVMRCVDLVIVMKKIVDSVTEKIDMTKSGSALTDEDMMISKPKDNPVKPTDASVSFETENRSKFGENFCVDEERSNKKASKSTPNNYVCLVVAEICAVIECLTLCCDLVSQLEDVILSVKENSQTQGDALKKHDEESSDSEIDNDENNVENDDTDDDPEMNIDIAESLPPAPQNAVNRILYSSCSYIGSSSSCLQPTTDCLLPALSSRKLSDSQSAVQNVTDFTNDQSQDDDHKLREYYLVLEVSVGGKMHRKKICLDDPTKAIFYYLLKLYLQSCEDIPEVNFTDIFNPVYTIYLCKQQDNEPSYVFSEKVPEQDDLAYKCFSLLNRIRLLHSLDAEIFRFNQIEKKLNHMLSEPLLVCCQAFPSWCYRLVQYHHFVVPFETRSRFFNSTSFGRWRSIIHMVRNNPQSCSESVHSKYNRLKTERFRVKRENILKSAYEIFRYNTHSQARLEVQFENEEGTGSGPTLEYYTLLSREFQRYDLGMWLSNPSSNSIYVEWPSGLFPAPYEQDSSLLTNVCTYFKTFGMVVAKCLMDHRYCPMNLSLPFLKIFCTDGDLNLNDLRDIDPFRCEILERLSSHSLPPSQIEQLGLTFEYNPPSMAYGYSKVLLSDESGNVTAENVVQYIEATLSFLLRKGIERQINAFKEGFNSFYDVATLRCFEPAELRQTLCGELYPSWTRSELYDYIDVHSGYTKSGSQFKAFVNVLMTLTKNERQNFIQFVTGSHCLPAGGLAQLNPRISIAYKGGSGYPSVNTCLHYIKLPHFDTEQELLELVRNAINMEHGFYFN